MADPPSNRPVKLSVALLLFFFLFRLFASGMSMGWLAGISAQKQPTNQCCCLCTIYYLYVCIYRHTYMYTHTHIYTHEHPIQVSSSKLTFLEKRLIDQPEDHKLTGPFRGIQIEGWAKEVGISFTEFRIKGVLSLSRTEKYRYSYIY